MGRGKCSPIERIAILRDNIVETKLLSQRASSIDILLFVIAQGCLHRNFRQRANRLDYITASSSCDIENVNRSIFRLHFFNQGPQRFFEIRFALPDAAPANAVEIRFVDHTAETHRAARLIFINVIEGQAGIETAAPANLDATA